MRKLTTYILLLFCFTVYGQENQPDAKLLEYGMTFPEGDYNVPDTTDYASKVYIDYSASSDGDGTINSPWKYIYDKTLSSNTAYLFKKGVYHAETSRSITITVDNILIGAWGLTGDRPQIKFYKLQFYHDDGVIRDVHLYDCTTSSVWIGQQHVDHSNFWIYNCEININGLFIWSDSTKVIRNVIHHQRDDNVFAKGTGNGGGSNEYAYNYMYAASQDWYDASFSPRGDAIQLSTHTNTHVHHNVLDRSETGNKFCIISRDESDYYGGTPMTAVYEYNVFLTPSNASDPFGVSYGGATLYFEEPQNVTVRYNRFIAAHTSLTHIYVNSGTGGIEAYGNTTIGCSDPFYSSNTNKFYNNTFYGHDDLSGGTLSGTYVKNNIFNIYDSRYDASNLFIDQEGATNLFVDAVNDDFNLIATSPAIDAGTWDGANMDSDFTEDLNGTTVPQNSNIDIGALQYISVGACDGITITPIGTAYPDTVNQSLGKITVSSIDGNGTSPYTYLWSNGATTQSIDSVPAGQYTLTVTDANTCTGQAIFTVNNVTSVSDGSIEIVEIYVSDSLSAEYGSLKMIDNDILSKWTTDEPDPYAVLKFDGTKQVDSLTVTVYVNSEDYYSFQQAINGQWQDVVNCTTSVGSTTFTFDIDFIADSVKLISNGRLVEGSPNPWVSVYEIDLFGYDYTIPTSNSWYDSLDLWLPFNNNTLDTFNQNNGVGTNITFVDGYDGKTSGAINTTSAGYVQISDLNYGASQEWTISMRIYPTATFKLLGNYDSDNEIQYIDNGDIRFDNTGTPVDLDANFTPDEWHMLTITASNDGYLRVYTDTVITDSTLLTDNAFRFTHIGGTSIQFDGYIDDFRTASTAFDITGIKAMANDFALDPNPCDGTTITPIGIVNNVNCANGSDGSVALSVSGGTLPYTYSWSNGTTSKDLLNVSASTYSVTITDSNGCDTTKSYTITQPTSIYAQLTNYKELDCYDGNDRDVAIQGFGGTPPYTYYWTTLDVYAQRIDTLRRFSYPILITDANGCTFQATSTTVPPDPISINYDVLNSKNYDNKTGTGIILNEPSGGTGQLTYLWNNGITTTKDRSGLTPGGYTISITDANGCVQNFDYVIRYVFDPNIKKSTGIKTNKGLLLQNGKVKL